MFLNYLDRCRMKQEESQGESRVRENFMHGLVGEVKPVRRRGFTLIELLVVVAIIGILSSMILPSLTKAREKGKIAVCKNNLKQNGYAASMYVDGNNGWLALSTSNWSVSISNTSRRAVMMGFYAELMDNNSETLYCPSMPDRMVITPAYK
jgi:prepilin-type N-terminal cleavage/methylation domain-containing protein